MPERAHRKRSLKITYRLTESEKNELQAKEQEAGFSRNQFFLSLIDQQQIFPREQLVELNKNIKGYYTELRRIGVNINQLAKKANSSGHQPELQKLEEISEIIKAMEEEVKEPWQYLRQLITRR